MTPIDGACVCEENKYLVFYYSLKFFRPILILILQLSNHHLHVKMLQFLIAIPIQNFLFHKHMMF